MVFCSLFFVDFTFFGSVVWNFCGGFNGFPCKLSKRWSSKAKQAYPNSFHDSLWMQLGQLHRILLNSVWLLASS